MQSYDFFAHAHGKRARAVWAFIFIGLWCQSLLIPLGAEQIDLANPQPTSASSSDSSLSLSSSLPSPSPSPTESAFLSLPAYDLGRIGQGDIQVGDVLLLRLLGVADGQDSKWTGVSLDIPAGVHLQEEGWEIDLREAGNENAQESSHQRRKASGTGSGNEQQAIRSEIMFGVIPLKPGQLTLPSLALKDAQGNLIGRTHPLSVEVHSAIKPDDPQPNQPADIEPPVGIRFPTWIVALAGLIGFVCLGTILFAFYRLWQKRRPKRPASPAIVLREDEVALKDLEALAHQDLLKKGQYKLVYFKISEILKAYVGERYRIDALESTSHEMIVALKERKDPSPTLLSHLESVFQRLDRVKFTDYFPDLNDSEKLFSEAKDFVLMTRRMSLTGGILGSNEVEKEPKSEHSVVPSMNEKREVNQDAL